MGISLSTYIIHITDKPQDYLSIEKLRQKIMELLCMRDGQKE